jgi:hypothetical protein
MMVSGKALQTVGSDAAYVVAAATLKKRMEVQLAVEVPEPLMPALRFELGNSMAPLADAIKHFGAIRVDTEQPPTLPTAVAPAMPAAVAPALPTAVAPALPAAVAPAAPEPQGQSPVAC